MPTLESIAVKVIQIPFIMGISSLAAMVWVYTGLPTNILYSVSPDEITSCEAEGNVRLHSGTDSSNGYVKYCEDRRWVGVCSDGWDDAEARVLCTQLNLESNGINTCIACITKP